MFTQLVKFQADLIVNTDICKRFVCIIDRECLMAYSTKLTVDAFNF